MQGYGATSYGDAFADVYDDWYPPDADSDAAVAALARLAEGGRVLELGCGTGRLALPLAARGLAVTALDASAAMLARLAAKPGAEDVAVIRADMATFALAQRFSLAFAAFNTLFNLPDAAAQRACFATVAAHLVPGGRFAVECFVPGDPPAPDERPDRVEVRLLTADRVVLRISHQDADSQVVAGQHVELSEGSVRLRPWRLRYALPVELDEAATLAGLELEHRWSSWLGARFDEDATQHVSVYRRSAAGSSAAGSSAAGGSAASGPSA